MHQILKLKKQFEETDYLYYTDKKQPYMRSKRWRWYIVAHQNKPPKQYIDTENGFAYYVQNIKAGKKRFCLLSRQSDKPNSQPCYFVDDCFLEWLLGKPCENPQELIEQVRGRRYAPEQCYFSTDWITKHLLRVLDRRNRKKR